MCSQIASALPVVTVFWLQLCDPHFALLLYHGPERSRPAPFAILNDVGVRWPSLVSLSSLAPRSAPSVVLWSMALNGSTSLF